MRCESKLLSGLEPLDMAPVAQFRMVDHHKLCTLPAFQLGISTKVLPDSQPAFVAW